MKALFLTFVIFITGCATVDPARIKLVVEPVKQACGASDQEIPVHLTVHNDSRGTLKVWIDPKSHQPPYALSWLSYEILDDGGPIDWKHGPGGHGPVPPSTLSIGPGDSTEVMGSLYSLSQADYVKSFKIQFKDLADHTFVSRSFKPCVAK